MYPSATRGEIFFITCCIYYDNRRLLCSKVFRAVPFYILWGGRVTRSNFVWGDMGVMIKNWKTLTGVGGYRPNFKHDYEEKTVKTYDWIGGTPVFSKKNMGG